MLLARASRRRRASPSSPSAGGGGGPAVPGALGGRGGRLGRDLGGGVGGRLLRLAGRVLDVDEAETDELADRADRGELARPEAVAERGDRAATGDGPDRLPLLGADRDRRLAQLRAEAHPGVDGGNDRRSSSRHSAEHALGVAERRLDLDGLSRLGRCAVELEAERPPVDPQQLEHDVGRRPLVGRVGALGRQHLAAVDPDGPERRETPCTWRRPDLLVAASSRRTSAMANVSIVPCSDTLASSPPAERGMRGQRFTERAAQVWFTLPAPHGLCSPCSRSSRARTRPSIASRIAVIGAARPVQSSNARPAWCSSMPDAADRHRSARVRDFEQRRTQRMIDEIGDDLAGTDRAWIDRQPHGCSDAVALHADRGRIDDQIGLAGRAVARPEDR